MELWKVSVVVPIYNVEKYIYRCIDSIINQTYSNIEIILVDDGSTDKCGEIIKDFSKADSRIKIIHKKNGGLSDARNKGMEYVSGEFVLFVDSDDWLDTKIIEEMINNCLKYNADIVQTAFYYAYDDYLLLDNRIFSKDDHIIILNNISLMSELVINERVKNFAWGKLYKTDLIKDIPFEKGVLFEDVFWAHKVMHRVNKYVILNQPLCYYYQRSDSIVSTYTLKNLDIIKGLKKRHKFIEEYYKDLTDKSYKVILKASLINYNLLLVNSKKDKNGINRKEIKLYIKNNYSKLRNAAKGDRYLLIQLFLFKIHPNLNVLPLIIDKVLRRLKMKSKPPLELKRINL